MVTGHDVFKVPKMLVRKYNTCDPFELARELHIIVKYRSDFVKQRGASVIILGNRMIFINANMSEQMQRMPRSEDRSWLVSYIRAADSRTCPLQHLKCP